MFCVLITCIGLANYWMQQNERTRACAKAVLLRDTLVPAARARTCNGEQCEQDKHFTNYSESMVRAITQKFKC
jgi:hypothetical protein